MKTLPTSSPSTTAVLEDRNPAFGNGSHLYAIQYGGPNDVLRVQFQKGPRGVEGSTPGIFNEDLLAILIDRMEGFQSGKYASEDNALALDSLRAAQVALGQRAAKRLAAGTLGTTKV